MSDDVVGGGLSPADVADRENAGLTNAVAHSSSRSFWQIFRANVFTLFNAIVATSFILLLALGQWKDALFGVTAVTNAIIGVVQEYKAKRLLDALAILTAPDVRVLRGGETVSIPSARVVRDDVLVLRTGDQVSADALVLAGEGLQVDESLLTGESLAVERRPGDTLLSGSSVVAGNGFARATAVGPASFASGLTAEARRFSLVHSEIRTATNRVLRSIAIALAPIMLVVINGQMQTLGGWRVALETGSWRLGAVGAVASVIAIVPLGLVLMTSVAFAVGGVRLARRNVLIQELASVEGLARVDVLCLDKTGTLTEGSIDFDTVHVLGQGVSREAGPVNPGSMPADSGAWRSALAWMATEPNANETARSMEGVFGGGAAGGGAALLEHQVPVAVVPFDSVSKWSAVCFASGAAGSQPGLGGTWVLGAPELVFAEERGDSPRSDEVRDALARASTLASSGLRTLVFAHSTVLLAPDAADEGVTVLPAALVPVALLTFREKVRADAASTLRYFRTEGISLRIISGDDPRTVAAVARRVGFDAGEGFDARNLPDDLAELADLLEVQRVFGRVTPRQKETMVRALQSHGHTVAMTGDGVNDALALKQADLGIAMGSAAPATKAVARLVLLDGRFSSLPAVVAEGRRVIANVERVSMLYLSKAAYAALISVVFGLLLWGFPFLPRQLSALDGLTIGLPSFFLALMPNSRRYSAGFLRRSLTFAAPAGVIVTLAVFAVNLTARSGASIALPIEARSASVLTLAVLGLGILGVASRPLDRVRVAIIAAMIVGTALLFTIPLARDFFELTVPKGDLLTATVVASAGGLVALEILARVRAHARWGR
ncbi:HAD-IC family P-type ATPase [Subtercola frigoramans]|uniref:Cation-transporting ATPase E n=1 Tax=Subtercola frigoramans TaxID=120298 RepID=A0ABS2L7G3_9MICO|nr:HAD-IC family P-type ATPase [Subtercola frigoramans]MBM7473012.1 cation-transporting ATPase E [Subtercola frigoramans]